MRAEEGINRLVQQYEGEGRKLLRIETWANCLYLRFDRGRNTMITRKGRKNWGGVGKAWDIRWHSKSGRRYKIVAMAAWETMYWFNPKKWREEEEERERQRRFREERERRLDEEYFQSYREALQDLKARRDWFADCRTKEEIKKRYRELARQFHPDCGGSAEQFRALKAKYDEILEIIAV